MLLRINEATQNRDIYRIYFHHNSNSIQHLFCSHWNSSAASAAIIYTCHDSSAAQCYSIVATWKRLSTPYCLITFTHWGRCRIYALVKCVIIGSDNGLVPNRRQAIVLTHWGRVTHICVTKLTIIGLDNGLSPGRRQAIIWTNAEILLIGALGTNVSEIWIKIDTFSLKKMHLKMSSGKRRPSCLGLNVLTNEYILPCVPLTTNSSEI